MAETDATVAIYWDFENVHAGVLDDLYGKNTYRDSGWSKQKRVVDVARVVEYAASFGRVVVHRAYNNWQFFSDYSTSLQEHAIDLVQLFPLTKTKNGADIRLAVDVMDDLRGQAQISHVVVVSSDCDYTALAQRCRSHGRRFIGVGTGPAAYGYRVACDEFRRYQELPASPRFVPPAPPVAPGDGAGAGCASATGGTAAGGAGASFDAAGDVVEQAIRRLAAEYGGPWVLKAAVLPAVQKLDPAFNHKALGFATFPLLLAALGGRILERTGQYDHELAVRADLRALPADSADSAATSDADAHHDAGGDSADPAGPADPFGLFGATPATLIEGQLKKRKQRLPADKQLLWTGTGLIAEIFAAAPDGIVASFDSLWQQFEAAAAAQPGSAVSEAEFKKLKAILWRAHAFEPLGFALGLRLQEPDAAAMRLGAVSTLLRLLPDPAEVAPAVLAEAIFGPDATPEQQDLIVAALQVLAQRPAPAPADAADADADANADADAEEPDCHDGAECADADADITGNGGHPDEPTAWESAA